MGVSQARLEERPGLAGIHVWDAHERQQVLAHPRCRHLRRGEAWRAMQLGVSGWQPAEQSTRLASWTIPSSSASCHSCRCNEGCMLQDCDLQSSRPTWLRLE